MQMKQFEPWKTAARRTLLDRGKYLVVEDHTVQLPDGRVIAGWDWIITPDYINALVMTADDTFLLFRQTKYAIEGTSLAPLGGYIEAGEAPLESARRELEEEMGCVANEWIDLGRYVVDGNRGAGIANLFLARGARRVHATHSDDLEEQELVELTQGELRAALRDGEFKVLAWSAVVALALDYLTNHA